VVAIVATAALSAALSRLVEQPSRYGYGWDVSVRSADVARIAADPDVTAAAPLWRVLRLRISGRSLTGFAFDTRAHDPAPVIVKGRLPRSPDEVVLGAKTLRRAGVALGGRVDVQDRTFRVVGQGLFPTTVDGFPLADGVLVTREAMEALPLDIGGEAPWTSLVIARWRPHVNRIQVVARLTEAANSEPPEEVIVPQEVDQLRQLRRFPVVLGGLLFAIATIGIGQLLALSIHRQGPNRAVLRALGCNRRQVRCMVAAHASTVAIIAASIGLPVGALVGNEVWAAVARSYGLHDDAALPVLVLILTLPVGLVMANALAWWPAREVRQRHTGASLDIE
jgi:predicted lysophospholipase L1 biosynthesis ABC-type transport system permease subunit